MKTVLRILALATIAAGAGGCFWAAVGGAGAEGGYIAAQDNRTTSEVVADQMLFTKVKAALAGAPKVSSGSITVSVRKSVVMLKGVLSSQDEKNKALAAAKGVKDVKGVIDKLYVNP